MTKYSTLTFLIFTTLFLSSCNNSITSSDLLGKWEAISIIEEGVPVEIDYPIIRLFVSDNGTYDYSGTLNYKESGRWHTQDKYFVTKDTLLPDAIEKTMLISNLTENSFEMKSEEGGKERVLMMIKSGL